MTRGTSGVSTHRRHKWVIKHAKGYQGRNKNCYTIAKNRVEHGWLHSYIDRKKKKRVYRALHIQRINAAVRSEGINYSRFMNGLKKENINFDRKVLSNMAISYPEQFSNLVKRVLSA